MSFLLKGIKLPFFSSQGLLGLPVAAAATTTSLFCPAQALIYMPGPAPGTIGCYSAATLQPMVSRLVRGGDFHGGMPVLVFKATELLVALRLVPFVGVSCFPWGSMEA